MKDKRVNTHTCAQTRTHTDCVGIVKSRMLRLYSQSLLENIRRTISFLIESCSLFHCFINNFALH